MTDAEIELQLLSPVSDKDALKVLIWDLVSEIADSYEWEVWG